MITVLARDKSGTIILRDYRGESYVLLECHEFAPSGGGGVVGVPDNEEFPMLRDVAESQGLRIAEQTDTHPFSLEVDISSMPRGQLRFQSREFIERAVEESEVAKQAKITPKNAKAWGFLDSLEHEAN